MAQREEWEIRKKSSSERVSRKLFMGAIPFRIFKSKAVMEAIFAQRS
jgi:hypothetical protein